MTATQIVAAIEEIAPLYYQETYDNAGFCVGNPQTEINGALLCVDVTEAVLDEALAAGANLIISHHPVIFKGLKQLTGKTPAERVIEKAVKNNLVLYAAHTNVDNVTQGVSFAMARQLGLKDVRVLAPRRGDLAKLSVFVPPAQADTLRMALFAAGAGNIGNYSHCSFNAPGEGTYFPHEGTHPFAGSPGALHTEPEIRVETIVPRALLQQVIKAMLQTHPYEEPAYDIYPLDNTFSQAGSGAVGNLPSPLAVDDFLQLLHKTFSVPAIRYSQTSSKSVRRVALCGGSGAFLLPEAKAVEAQAFVSADFKYHDFFDADNRMLIADVGHFESERCALDIFYNCLTKKFPTFAVHFTKNNTNPVMYWFSNQ